MNRRTKLAAAPVAAAVATAATILLTANGQVGPRADRDQLPDYGVQGRSAMGVPVWFTGRTEFPNGDEACDQARLGQTSACFTVIEQLPDTGEEHACDVNLQLRGLLFLAFCNDPPGKNVLATRGLR